MEEFVKHLQGVAIENAMHPKLVEPDRSTQV